SGWEDVSGTGVAADLFAGLIAIADQGRAENDLPTLDTRDTLSALYSFPSDFNDITEGSNTSYSAGPGYDLVTGLGSPNAADLVPDLALWVGYAPRGTNSTITLTQSGGTFTIAEN